MRTPYLGDTLVWTFRDDAERLTYKASRRWPGYRVWSFIVLPAIVVGLIAFSFSRGNYAGMVGITLAEVGRQLWAWYLDKKTDLLSLDLILLPDRLMLTEHYGRGLKLHERQLGLFKAKHVKSAVWVSDGCLLIMNRWRTSVRRVLLHRGLLSSQQSLESLYRWAEVHKITIDGVPPLPGGYVRPIEERRGL